MNNDSPQSARSACPECGNPVVWSVDHETLWCSVYGFHAPAEAPGSDCTGRSWHPVIHALMGVDLKAA